MECVAGEEAVAAVPLGQLQMGVPGADGSESVARKPEIDERIEIQSRHMIAPDCRLDDELFVLGLESDGLGHGERFGTLYGHVPDAHVRRDERAHPPDGRGQEGTGQRAFESQRT